MNRIIHGAAADVRAAGRFWTWRYAARSRPPGFSWRLSASGSRPREPIPQPPAMPPQPRIITKT
ncbi:MAG: hypothetical protein M3452_11625, partial [Chloroflexota bacterium]|nr:hypothetical protein [Chloroflexota bacterium]